MGKTALVTGGGRGIGAGIVDKLAAEGWNVAFCGRHEAEAFAERTAELEKRYGVGALYVRADISSRQDREALLAAVLERFGSLEALVNNAGVAPTVRCDLLEMTEESFDRVMGINLKGPFFLTQAVGRSSTRRVCMPMKFTICCCRTRSPSPRAAANTACRRRAWRWRRSCMPSKWRNSACRSMRSGRE